MTVSDQSQEIERACLEPSEESVRTLLRLATGRGRRYESGRFELKEDFDNSTRARCSVLADAVSLSNTTGGVIIFGVNNSGESVGIREGVASRLDPAKIQDKLARYSTGSAVSTVTVESTYYRRLYCALFVLPGNGLIVFDRDGNFSDERGKTGSEFRAGLVYVRREGREPLPIKLKAT